MHLWNEVPDELTIINMDEVLSIDIHVNNFKGYQPNWFERLLFDAKPSPPSTHYTAFINFKGAKLSLRLYGDAGEAMFKKMQEFRNFRP